MKQWLTLVLGVAVGFATRVQAYDVLLFQSTDFGGQSSSNAHAALESMAPLGVSFTTSGVGDFNAQLGGGAWDAVVIDAFDDIPVAGTDDWDALKAYVDQGGRAVMSFYDGGGDVYAGLGGTLNAFGVNQGLSQNYTSFKDLVPWVPAHPILQGITTPLTNWVDKYFYHGADAFGSGDADLMVTAIVGGSPAPPGGFFSDGAIIETANTNGSRTIYNSFNTDELEPLIARQLLRNEVMYVLGIPEPGTLLLFAPSLALLWWLARRR